MEEQDLEKGMKLEAVNPVQPGQICAATINAVIGGQLLHLRLDHLGPTIPGHEFLVPVDSFDIFPIGWCESNDYQLKAPILRSLAGSSAKCVARRTE